MISLHNETKFIVKQILKFIEWSNPKLWFSIPDRVFSRIGSLKHHYHSCRKVKIKLPGESTEPETFVCDQCGESFTDKVKLKIHRSENLTHFSFSFLNFKLIFFITCLQVLSLYSVFKINEFF